MSSRGTSPLQVPTRIHVFIVKRNVERRPHGYMKFQPEGAGSGGGGGGGGEEGGREGEAGGKEEEEEEEEEE